MAAAPVGRGTPFAQRAALRLAKHVPEPLLAYPERVVVNLAAIIMGIAALWPPRGGVADLWPDWFAYEWSAAMVIAGLAALHGTWTGYRPSERLGAGLFAVGAAVFAVTAAVYFGFSATATATLFGLLSLAKLIRLVRSLAVSAQITTAIREHDEGGGQDHAVESPWQQDDGRADA